MLIVGDVPYKKDIDSKFEVQSVDIIVEPENIDKVLKELDIKNERGIYLGEEVTMYVQNKVKYLIMSAKTNAYLKILIRQNYATQSLRVATPAINYAFLWYTSRMSYHDPTTWLKVVKQTKDLKPHFYNTFKTRKKQFKLLSCGERIALRYFSKLSHFSSPYEKIGFVKYDKYGLLAAIGSTFHSPYKKITIPGETEFFHEKAWNTLTIHEKKVAALEMIYLHEISEIFISELFINKKYPDMVKWKYHFLESIMDIVTSKRNDMDFIKLFMLENIEELMISFRPALLTNFIHAEKDGILIPLKSWIYENK